MINEREYILYLGCGSLSIKSVLNALLKARVPNFKFEDLIEVQKVVLKGYLADLGNVEPYVYLYPQDTKTSNEIQFVWGTVFKIYGNRKDILSAIIYYHKPSPNTCYLCVKPIILLDKKEYLCITFLSLPLSLKKTKMHRRVWSSSWFDYLKVVSQYQKKQNLLPLL